MPKILRSPDALIDNILSFIRCIVVDSTRRGKRYPDALSKTVPIWCATINQAVEQFRGKQVGHTGRHEHPSGASDHWKHQTWDANFYSMRSVVSESEHDNIAKRIPFFVEKLLVKHAAAVLLVLWTYVYILFGLRISRTRVSA
jgi:tRNA A64-2'-O-ribosylphosphate transferase